MRYKKILLFFIVFISITTKTFSTDTTNTTEEIMSSQKESFGISSFIEEAQKYSKETFGDINMNDVLNSAIAGEVDNNSIWEKIVELFGAEIKSMLKVLRYNFSYHCCS